MKNILHFSLLFLVSFSIKAQIINFPDANFKAKLLTSSSTNNVAKNSLGYSIKIDTNNNGQIEQSEALQVHHLSFYVYNGPPPFKMANSPLANEITNLTGIAYFTNLRSLNVTRNQISSMNLSSNTFLNYLDCSYNAITSLSSIVLPNSLASLFINNNNLTSLNTTSFSNLTTLNCSSTGLSSSNLILNSQLVNLYCSNNSITSYNFNAFTNLTSLNVSNNNLTSLNLSNNTLLQTLDCNHNQLSNLNLTTNNQLKNLYCYNNQLTSLNLNNATQLQSLDCSYNTINSLNLVNNTTLAFLTANNNSLTSLNVTGLSLLRYFYCYSNQLPSLDLTGLNSLVYLDCNDNLLTNLNLTNLVQLEKAYCSNNQLTNLQISNCMTLGTLVCNDNNLTSIDLSNSSVIRLVCSNNPNLSFINLKNNAISDYYYYDIVPIPPMPSFEFANLNSLAQICCDASEINVIQSFLPNLNTSVGDFCSGKSIVVLKLNVQGLYDLNNQNMLAFKSTTTSSSVTNNTDDISVELRNASGTLISSTTTSLKTNGGAVCLFNGQPSGSYYVGVKSSNSVRTWSATPQTISTIPLLYDFTTSSSKAYGNNLVQLSAGVFGLYSGDINNDGNIDNSDYSAWEIDANDFAYGFYITDLNGDGNVDNSDFSIWETNNNNFIYSVTPFP